MQNLIEDISPTVEVHNNHSYVQWEEPALVSIHVSTETSMRWSQDHLIHTKQKGVTTYDSFHTPILHRLGDLQE